MPKMHGQPQPNPPANGRFTGVQSTGWEGNFSVNYANKKNVREVHSLYYGDMTCDCGCGHAEHVSDCSSSCACGGALEGLHDLP